MKTDRELLEQAAKAAGINAQYSENMGDFSIGVPYSRGEVRWNPLTDDGDALRLAASLMIDVEWETEWVVFSDGNFSEDIKHHNNDRAAAIRRVVVRAAADIAEAMP